MNEPTDIPSYPQRSSGAVVLGLLLVAAGVAMFLDRTGALPTPWRLSVWPLLLMGYGIARLTQPRLDGPGGLFFLLVGAWWLSGVLGWLSMVRTWPLLIVALGLSVVFEVVTAVPRGAPDLAAVRRHGVAAILLPVIVVGALLSSGVGPGVRHGLVATGGEVHSIAVMGRRSGRVPSTTFTGGDLVVVMGANTVDLRDVVIAPGSTATLNVIGLMGAAVVTVPRGWVVDVQAIPIMGHVSEAEDAADWTDSNTSPPAAPAAAAPGGDGPAPRLVIRGAVIMGRLSVTS
jgi:hypothetical protein